MENRMPHASTASDRPEARTRSISAERLYYEHDAFWNPEITTLNSSPIDQMRVAEVLESLPSGVNSLLDAGCGNGLFSEHARRRAPAMRVVALDRSAAAVRYAGSPRLLGDLAALPFASGSFDAVVSLEVLEHLPVPLYDAARAELARVARTTIVVTVPNRQRLGEGMTQCPECRAMFDPDLHMRSFDVARLETLFQPYGFRAQTVREIGRAEGFRRIPLLQPAASQPSSMLSPICPVCSFQNPEHNLAAPRETSSPRRKRSATYVAVADLVKRALLRTTSYRWMMAVYVPR